MFQLKYDVVVSGYTLMELPSARTRLETIMNLWNKTNKYLVIVERGTNAGFRVSVWLNNLCFIQ
jgi:ribosomal protein RSM22 (predicted rRNA methylase)